jgi:molybdopterin converting factor small subunit
VHDSLMKITVHLHTILQRQTPEGLVGRVEVSLPPGSALNDVLAHLEIDLTPEQLLLVVNGRMAELVQELHDGDVVNLMPALSGG